MYVLMLMEDGEYSRRIQAGLHSQTRGIEVVIITTFAAARRHFDEKMGNIFAIVIDAAFECPERPIARCVKAVQAWRGLGFTGPIFAASSFTDLELRAEGCEGVQPNDVVDRLLKELETTHARRAS